MDKEVFILLYSQLFNTLEFFFLVKKQKKTKKHFLSYMELSTLSSDKSKVWVCVCLSVRPWRNT